MKTTKILKWLPMLALVAIMAAGCTDGNNGGNNPTTMELTGTKWKLIKLTNTKTGVEKPIYVGDDICTKFVPTMDFETNTTGILRISNKNHDVIDGDKIDYMQLQIDLKDTNRWFSHPAPTANEDNIGTYMLLFPNSYLLNTSFPNTPRHNYHPSGSPDYKIEDNLLKFYYYDDGFFYFDTNCVITQMFACGDLGELLTDSNWYNCAVFEEVK